MIKCPDKRALQQNTNCFEINFNHNQQWFCMRNKRITVEQEPIQALTWSHKNDHTHKKEKQGSGKRTA